MKRGRLILFTAGGGVRYLSRDEFSVDRTAGNVNGTASEPGPGTRVIVDTTPGALITGGRYSARTNVDWGNPGIWSSMSFARSKGRMLFANVFPRGVAANGLIGWHAAQTGLGTAGLLLFHSSGYIKHFPSNVNLMQYKSGVNYPVMIGLRASGVDCYIQINGLWKLIWRSATETSNPVYAAMTNILDMGRWSSPDTLWMLTPLASDGFGGAFGVTDGLGHAETSGLGSGGSGVAWAQQVGTWSNAAGKSSGTTDGGLAIATVTPNTSNYFVDANLVRAGGNVGIVLRYTDASNYVYAYHDGTNVTLRKVVAGVDSEVIAPVAAAYAAGATLRVIADASSFTMFYNNAAAGTATISDAVLASGAVGLYTTNDGNTFDNLQVLATGSENQYSRLFKWSPLVLYQNCLFYGDSKTLNTGDGENIGGYVPRMNLETRNFYPVPPLIATAGITTATAAAGIDASLLSASGTPDLVLINLGVNDLAGINAGTIIKADWQTNFAYILDAIHTKWPVARVYCMRVWGRGYGAEANTQASWQAELITARSSWCFAGPDERVFLENGDDGVTYTGDGIHPNAAGYALTAVQWRTVLGF